MTIFSFKEKTLFFMLFLVSTGIFLLPITAYLTTISPENIIEQSNKIRQEKGLNALTVNAELSQAAQNKARSIFLSQEFAHNLGDRKFSTWITAAGYEFSYAGENLAMDFYTAEGVIEAWMNSDSHRSNLLSPQFSEIGVAVVEGELHGQHTALTVQIFGTPPLNQSLPLATDPGNTGAVPEWHMNHAGSLEFVSPAMPGLDLNLKAWLNELMNRSYQQVQSFNIELLISVNLLLVVCLLLLSLPIIFSAYLKNRESLEHQV